MEIRGETVVLRGWRPDDAPAVMQACQDPAIARWLQLVPQPYTEEDARFYVESCMAAAEDRYPFAVTASATGEVIGSIDMHVNRMKTGHAGYWLAAGARGRGHMTDALRALSRWAFDELGLGRMELATDPDNVASQRVAERAGYLREGTLRAMLVNRDGSRRDGVMFSLLPADLDSGGA